jgi:PPOX class probable F420-dependent enzyme
MELLSDTELRFLAACRVARLATADAGGAPHVLPVCFAAEPATVYTTVDEKPKRPGPRRLKRLANIAENPKAALVVDRYDDDDWSRLGWVMVRGRAQVLADGPEHDAAQRALIARYRQYASMRLGHLPVIALRIERVSRWGDLSLPGGGA